MKKVSEITEERYYEMLGAVPPVVIATGWFQLGEPYSSDPETGKPTYGLFVKAKGKFYELGAYTLPAARDLDKAAAIEDFLAEAG